MSNVRYIQMTGMSLQPLLQITITCLEYLSNLHKAINCSRSKQGSQIQSIVICNAPP